MSTALVTGANGFVGSHICEALLGSGFDVRALVRRTSNLANLRGLSVNLAFGDLNDPESLGPAVTGVDYVVNNAGLTRALTPEQFHKVNASGTENILDAILTSNLELGRFVQISSTAACGPASSATPMNEGSPPRPLTAYGRSKLAGEKATLSFKEKLPVTILRPCAVYGPKDKDMLSFFKAVKLGIKPAFGHGGSYINFTYANDLAKAVVKALISQTPSGEIYFVAERKAYSYSEAGDIISQILRRRAIDVHVPTAIFYLVGRISEEIARWRGKPSILTAEKVIEIAQKFWLFDTSKIENEMGFVAPTDFRTGAAETIAWYKREGWL